MTSQEIRFWRRVSLCEHVASRIGEHYKDCVACCWEWKGAKHAGGSGRTRYLLQDGYESYAHRVAWAFAHHGASPTRDWEVAQTCDNPPCCNPAHLWLATHAQTIANRDMQGRTAPLAKGRQVQHGGARPRKLTWGKVAEMRALAATRRYTCKELGVRFGVSAAMVSTILCGRAWGGASEP